MSLLLEYVREVLRESTWYFGKRGPISFAEGRPAFFAKDREGAEWYAYERGSGQPTVYTIELVMHKQATTKDLRDAVKAVGATGKDIDANSSYQTDDNFTDYVYVPAVQKELESNGFDSYVGWDTLANDQIEIAVVWHPSQIRVVGEVTLKDRR